MTTPSLMDIKDSVIKKISFHSTPSKEELFDLIDEVLYQFALPKIKKNFLTIYVVTFFQNDINYIENHIKLQLLEY